MGWWAVPAYQQTIRPYLTPHPSPRPIKGTHEVRNEVKNTVNTKEQRGDWPLFVSMPEACLRPTIRMFGSAHRSALGHHRTPVIIRGGGT